ncbi:MAG: 4Fe-4S binding protein [Desulfobacterales bacterium]|jgi:ferredoxin|nr:4Fe-4S binding protein [Desulfobacterales bacterium]
MKVTRKIIQIDDELCDGCGQCVPNCAEGALQIVDGKARILADNLCDGLGACLGECPNGALKIIEREADDFDEHAVEKHLARQKDEKPMACGCPSHQIQTFMPSSAGQGTNRETASSASALSHWPIQIRLVPADAKFLKNAHLLVLADCAAVSLPNLHQELLAGKAVMMGCPKFDDAEAYIEKFKEVFAKAGIQSITIAYMEVPCCSGLPWIVKKALESGSFNIPVTEIVISARGKILSK